MNVGFDLDGVLYDWHYAVYSHCVANEDYTGSFTTFWSGHFSSFSLDKQNNFCIQESLFSKLFPSREIMDFLNAVSKKHTIFYITARESDVMQTTKEYLLTYKFPQRDNLIFTTDKATYIRLKRIEIFVDDFPSVLDSIGNIAMTFLVKKPWNSSVSSKYNTIESVLDLKGVLSV